MKITFSVLFLLLAAALYILVRPSIGSFGFAIGTSTAKPDSATVKRETASSNTKALAPAAPSAAPTQAPPSATKATAAATNIPVASSKTAVVTARSAALNHSPSSSASSAKAYPPMSLAAVLGPNNSFQDPMFGVSMTYPEGWTVRAASRWGSDNEQNTVWFQPPSGNMAQPSMYYQKYPNGAPATDNAEAMLREMAQEKEASRQQAAPDYQNDPDSFVFREINGHPALSYFATYSQAGQVRAEYFMRILGPTGYVMFFVRGPVNDVQALIPSVYQSGTTVRPP